MNVPGSDRVAAFREWTERRAEYIRVQGSNVVQTSDHNSSVLLSGIFKPYHVGANVEGLQPLVRFGQRPELSQATGMALVRCILGKFLGVV